MNVSFTDPAQTLQVRFIVQMIETVSVNHIILHHDGVFTQRVSEIIVLGVLGHLPATEAHQR